MQLRLRQKLSGICSAVQFNVLGIYSYCCWLISMLEFKFVSKPFFFVFFYMIFLRICFILMKVRAVY